MFNLGTKTIKCIQNLFNQIYEDALPNTWEIIRMIIPNPRPGKNNLKPKDLDQLLVFNYCVKYLKNWTIAVYRKYRNDNFYSPKQNGYKKKQIL